MEYQKAFIDKPITNELLAAVARGPFTSKNKAVACSTPLYICVFYHFVGGKSPRLHNARIKADFSRVGVRYRGFDKAITLLLNAYYLIGKIWVLFLGMFGWPSMGFQTECPRCRRAWKQPRQVIELKLEDTCEREENVVEGFMPTGIDLTNIGAGMEE